LAAKLPKKFLSHNKAYAFRRAATAGMFLESLQIIAVVESNFLASRNVAQGLDPDAALLAFGLAIGSATMIDTARGVPDKIAIEVKLVVQREDAPVLALATADRFGLGYFFAEIFEDVCAARQISIGKYTLAMNRGRADEDMIAHFQSLPRIDDCAKKKKRPGWIVANG
jgi:hypothetical protein